MDLQELQLPGYAFKVRASAKGEQIFDPVRQKYVALEPEEWVRQHFLNFLVEHRECPLSLISVESSMKLNGLTMRSDIVVHDKSGAPLVIVECKAPDIPIVQRTLDQVVRYDRVLKAGYLMLTNGLAHYCWQANHDNKQLLPLDKMPFYSEMLAQRLNINR